MVREVALTLLDGYGHKAVATLEDGAGAPCGNWTWRTRWWRTAVHRALESVKER